VALITSAVAGQRPAFYPDDPIARVADTQDASGVQPKSVNLVYDESRNLFGNPGDPDMNRRAQNVNTIDEVPDSSWYTNRQSRRSRKARTPRRARHRANGQLSRARATV
jgi:hypothetical protein